MVPERDRFLILLEPNGDTVDYSYLQSVAQVGELRPALLFQVLFTIGCHHDCLSANTT